MATIKQSHAVDKRVRIRELMWSRIGIATPPVMVISIRPRRETRSGVLKQGRKRTPGYYRYRPLSSRRESFCGGLCQLPPARPRRRKYFR
jgi:hypothetical protein